MAENEDRSGEDLSEEASPYKLEDYRSRGIVSQSKELSGVLALIAAAVTLYATAGRIHLDVTGYMRELFQVDQMVKLNLSEDGVLSKYLWQAMKVIGSACLPILGITMVFGVVGSFAQVGSIFSTDPITPDMSKIDPLKGMQRLFSPKQLVELLRVSLKVALFSWVAYALLKKEIVGAPIFLLSDIGSQLHGFADSGRRIFFGLVMVVTVFAIADLVWQRRQYLQNLKVTKQEAKQESKEREGDPQMKSRIRAIQRDAARKRMIQAVKKADVIVTNPTHFAVAIVYQKDKMAAPKVVAKGQDLIAQQIKKIAAEAGIPMVENVPLARTLFKSVKVGQYVPRNLYQAIAEVLAYVYRLKHQPGGRI